LTHSPTRRSSDLDDAPIAQKVVVDRSRPIANIYVVHALAARSDAREPNRVMISVCRGFRVLVRERKHRDAVNPNLDRPYRIAGEDFNLDVRPDTQADRSTRGCT